MSGDLGSVVKNMILRYIIIFLLSVTLFSCGQHGEKNSALSQPGRGEMADLNRYLIRKDRERIQNYIERKNLSMTETKTGLWYQIVKEGTGECFHDRDKIIMDYDCSLLDGTRCYSSLKLGPKEIILGHTGIEAGLSEGLYLLKPGSEAIFIIPPFLAYGLIGDRKSIPPRSILVYHVTVRAG